MGATDLNELILARGTSNDSINTLNVLIIKEPSNLWLKFVRCGVFMHQGPRQPVCVSLFGLNKRTYPLTSGPKESKPQSLKSHLTAISYGALHYQHPPSSCKSKVPPPPPPCLPYGFVQAPKQTKVRRKSDQDGKLLSSACLFNTWLQRGAMQRAERHYRRRAPNYALQCWSAEFSTKWSALHLHKIQFNCLHFLVFNLTCFELGVRSSAFPTVHSRASN